MKKAIIASQLALCVSSPALAVDKPGLQEDKAPPPPHKLDDGYRGIEDARVMNVEHAKTMHDGATVTLHGNIIKKLGNDTYRFQDRTGEIDVMIPEAVFQGKQFSPDDLVRFSGSLDKKHKNPQVRVTHFQKQ